MNNKEKTNQARVKPTQKICNKMALCTLAPPDLVDEVHGWSGAPGAAGNHRLVHKVPGCQGLTLTPLVYWYTLESSSSIVRLKNLFVV